MADKPDMEANYSMIDKIFRYSIGETADFTNAMYHGNFQLSLETAQRRKHKYIADQLHIGPGSKVLDMGCGWGPFLVYLREIGAEGIGVTLSDAQTRSCRKHGLHVHMMDLRELTPSDFGTFDAIVCIGAIEHLCSIHEWQMGKRGKIYCQFFKNTAGLLKDNGRLYVQTMTFNKNMLPYAEFDIDADKNSDAYILALMEKAQPGSWLPENVMQVETSASSWFKLIGKLNGRIDYIETITQWKNRMRKFQLKKYLIYLGMLPRFLWDKEFRYQLDILRNDPNKKCFERELMDHFRLVFEKI